MTLAKLYIVPIKKNGDRDEINAIEALFNPNKYKISKKINWNPKDGKNLDAPEIEFGSGGSRFLDFTLFYDVTEDRKTERDVRLQTNRISKLSRIDQALKRPPIIEINWGDAPDQSDFPFVGVITNLTQDFTMFGLDGRPLRATLPLTVMEYIEIQPSTGQVSTEIRNRFYKEGDTLSNISSEEYDHPSNWRLIAESNDIDDPRRITTGAKLSIPER